MAAPGDGTGEEAEEGGAIPGLSVEGLLAALGLDLRRHGSMLVQVGQGAGLQGGRHDCVAGLVACGGSPMRAVRGSCMLWGSCACDVGCMRALSLCTWCDSCAHGGRLMHAVGLTPAVLVQVGQQRLVRAVQCGDSVCTSRLEGGQQGYAVGAHPGPAVLAHVTPTARMQAEGSCWLLASGVRLAEPGVALFAR